MTAIYYHEHCSEFDFIRNDGVMNKNYSAAFISDESKYFKDLLQKIINELKFLPEGKLIIKHSKGKDRYYHYKPSKIPGVKAAEIYLGEKDEKFIVALCRKRFIEEIIPVIQEIISCGKLYCETCPEYNPTQIVQRLPEAYRGLDFSREFDTSENTKEYNWLNEPYDRNTLYPDNLVHTTQNGLRVRSKSESIIAGMLETYGIPFRYEAHLKLGGNDYYPDFTILNPQDNKIVYWEHFGMVDKEEYAESMHKKMENYIKHGILQGDNLIVTMETKDSPLNARKIRNTIKAHLLQESRAFDTT